jgi:hypothetical protein
MDMVWPGGARLGKARLALMSVCECCCCREQFTSVSSFDQHLDVDYDRVPPVMCREPRDLGMARDRHGRFFMPGSDADRVRLAALKARRVA